MIFFVAVYIKPCFLHPILPQRCLVLSSLMTSFSFVFFSSSFHPWIRNTHTLQCCFLWKAYVWRSLLSLFTSSSDSEEELLEESELDEEEDEECLTKTQWNQDLLDISLVNIRDQYWSNRTLCLCVQPVKWLSCPSKYWRFLLTLLDFFFSRFLFWRQI